MHCASREVTPRYKHAYHSTTLFHPLKGGDRIVDTALVTQVHARIYESGSAGSRKFNSFGGGEAYITKPPEELLIICLDTSSSMGEDAYFFAKEFDDNVADSDTCDSLSFGDKLSDDPYDEEELFSLPYNVIPWKIENVIGLDQYGVGNAEQSR